MYILGLATMGSSSACLFKNGKLVAAVEEERLSRIKNDGAFPVQAIRECLSIAGITMNQVEVVAVYWQPWRLAQRLKGTLAKSTMSLNGLQSMSRRVWDLFGPRKENSKRPEDTGSWSDLFKIKSILKSKFGASPANVFFADHHLSHQLYGEAMRDWKSFISLSYDGGGEDSSTVLSVVENGERKVLTDHKWPNSLGHFYSFFTGYLGFKMLEGEYKMMGLAPYGSPHLADDILQKILRLNPNGRYELNTRLCDYHSALRGHFPKQLSQWFGPPRRFDEEPTKAHIDLAASVQTAFERALVHVLAEARSSHPHLDRLVISGGCALNVTANGKLISNGLFKEVIIPPAPHDAGCSIGAVIAYLAAQQPQSSVDVDSVRSPYSGRTFSETEIQTQVDVFCKEKLKPKSAGDIVNKTAEMLSQGKIVSWFQGGAEFGPRALGARSYLADPRRDEIRESINAKIKKRELFRPFAPSCTEFAASTFFEITQPSPYMNIVATAKPDKREQIPAVVHTDGTARVHTVSVQSNPMYHALLSRFGELTGVPVLLNTSFNIQEPIVYSPSDAFKTFKSSGVDVLAIGNFLITRGDLK